MKQKTSKYIAALIIILGLVFIYFIPSITIFKNEFYKLFDQADIVVLVNDIDLTTERKMYGTIVKIVNKRNIPIKYKVGDRDIVGILRKPNINFDTVVPEGAVLFLKSPNSERIKDAENKWFFNKGKLGNGYTFQYVEKIMNGG